MNMYAAVEVCIYKNTLPVLPEACTILLDILLFFVLTVAVVLHSVLVPIVAPVAEAPRMAATSMVVAMAIVYAQRRVAATIFVIAFVCVTAFIRATRF